jgi:hypothetical protein
MLRREKEEKELAEVTLMPKTNRLKNSKLLESKRSASEDPF